METKWKDKTGKEKLLTVAYVIVGMIALVFAVVDFAELWEHAHAGWVFAFAVLCGLECLQRWNTNRKTAIIELVFCVVLLAFGVATILL